MYRIINSTKRSFIVKADEVIKGGKPGEKKDDKIIIPGPAIIEVTDKLGKVLSGYKNDGITIVEIIKEGKGK